MTVEQKRKVVEQHLIWLLRRQYGGDKEIHKIDWL